MDELAKHMPCRRFIDSMARMSYCSRKSQKPMTKYVPRDPRDMSTALTGEQIKRTIAEEAEVHAQFTHDRSFYAAQKAQPWESYTQGGGALISPDLGPGGVGLTFDGAADAPFDEEGPARYMPLDQGWNGQGLRFDVGVARRDFGSAMVRAGF